MPAATARPREEALRTTMGTRSTALALSAWRGHSERRYVVGIHTLDAEVLAEMGECVAIGVKRGNFGIAEAVSVAVSNPAGAAALVKAFARKGAVEMHVHRLAENAEECAAIVLDLKSERSR